LRLLIGDDYRATQTSGPPYSITYSIELGHYSFWMILNPQYT